MPSQKQNQRDKGQKQDRERTGQSDSDLKEREYRGPDGEVHHHTRKYMEQHGEQHGGKKGKDE